MSGFNMRNGESNMVDDLVLISLDNRLNSSSSVGPLFCLHFLGERLFVINSREVAADILEKNMNIYTGRPQNMVMASELYVLLRVSHVPSRLR